MAIQMFPQRNVYASRPIKKLTHPPIIPTSHTLQTPGRGGEVRLDTQIDLLVCILGPLAHRQRKARTEDPCIRSAELDLSVAGSVVGSGDGGFRQ